jgi:hypothetical protein
MASLQENRPFQVRAITAPSFLAESDDFSLVLGGPVYQLFRKAHLSGDHLDLLGRRLTAFLLIAWVPLVALSVIGPWIGGLGLLSFFRDVEVQVRFLVALPVFVIAELIVHLRVRPVVRKFVERHLILPLDIPRCICLPR